MKLVVFAHTPPPHHGQSYMVQVMLKTLGGDIRARPTAGAAGPAPSPSRGPVECYHVNARLSRDMDDLGTARSGKVFLLFRYCFQALVLRLRYGADALYYIPASSGRAAIYRDWIVMALCRPLFRRRIFHWHSVGWKDWVASARPWERWLSRSLLGQPALSMVLTDWGRRDAEACRSRRVEVVPNGLPDPCPNFATEVLPRRRARLEARRALLRGGGGKATAAMDNGGAEVFRVLFLGLCYRPKGLFDALEAVALLNQALAGTAVRAELSVAGKFWKETDRVDFEARLRQPDMKRDGRPIVDYRGFVQGAEKHRLLAESDCLCFPTYYEMEGFPLVLVEAMAYGLPALTTRWRGVPDVLPGGYPGLVEPQAPAAAAKALRQLMEWSDFEGLRAHYTGRFTEEQFDKRLLEALLTAQG